MEGLMLHCGGTKVTREELSNIQTPQGTATHCPIPHNRLVDLTLAAFEAGGLQIQSEQHGIAHEGNRYFGMFDLKSNNEEYSLLVGLRNSHDKSYPAALAVGSHVFVCDNLAFSSEITISRKHTCRIERDLDRLVAQAVGRLGDYRNRQDHRIEEYKRTELTPGVVHDLAIRSIDARVIPASLIPEVLKEYRQPRHPEFMPRTGWSLFNAYTQAMKKYPVADLSQRTQRLHGLLDIECRVN